MLRVHLNRVADLGLNGSGVILRQGVNLVPRSAWEKVAGHQLTRWYIGRGIVAVDEPKLEPAPAAASQAPSELPVVATHVEAVAHAKLDPEAVSHHVEPAPGRVEPEPQSQRQSKRRRNR